MFSFDKMDHDHLIHKGSQQKTLTRVVIHKQLVHCDVTLSLWYLVTGNNCYFYWYFVYFYMCKPDCTGKTFSHVSDCNYFHADSSLRPLQHFKFWCYLKIEWGTWSMHDNFCSSIVWAFSLELAVPSFACLKMLGWSKCLMAFTIFVISSYNLCHDFT